MITVTFVWGRDPLCQLEMTAAPAKRDQVELPDHAISTWKVVGVRHRPAEQAATAWVEPS